MTKADLIKAITDRTGFSAKDCSGIIENVFDSMKTALEKGDEVKISGFGVFTVKSKNVRPGRNPQTGEKVQIDARKVLRFKASSQLKEKMSV